jgi:hypothetical protein
MFNIWTTDVQKKSYCKESFAKTIVNLLITLLSMDIRIIENHILNSSYCMNIDGSHCNEILTKE